MKGWQEHEAYIQKLLGLDSTAASGAKFHDIGDAVDRSHPNDREFRLLADAKYCVDADTEILTRRGWLRHDEVRAGDETLGLREDGTASWATVNGVHTFPGEHEVMRWKWRRHDSVSTPDHRWLVERTNSRISYAWTTTDQIQTNDALVCGRELVEYPDQKYTDALVELVGWYWTEGCLHPHGAVSIAQCPVANPENWASIQAALVSCFGYAKAHGDGRAFYVGTKGGCADAITQHAPGKDKVLSLDFVLSLTKAQLQLLIDTSIRADGHSREQKGRHGRSDKVYQKHKASLDVLQIACQLLGRQSSLTHQSNGWCLHIFEKARVIPHTPARGRGEATTYRGVVWCPTTSTGTWLARRNGQVYFTGNTEKGSYSVNLKFLRQMSDKAVNLGKRFILPIRLWPSTEQLPHDYVVVSLDDFAELLEKARAWDELVGKRDISL